MRIGMSIILFLLALGTKAYAEESGSKPTFEMSGFVDLMYRSVTTNQADQNRAAESGFLVEDAALYLKKTDGKMTLFLDLPFSRQKFYSYKSPGPDTTNDPIFYSSKNANFDFAQGKAQAIVSYQVTDRIVVSGGQFDTIYGFELNDSPDRFFGQTGLVYNYAIPVTHTGALGIYNDGPITFKVMAANPNGRGSQTYTDTAGSNTITGGEDHTEYGATITWSSQSIHSTLGYLTRSKNDYLGKASHRSLIDALVGFTYNGWAFDFEYSQVSDPSADTDNNGTLDGRGEGKGILIFVTSPNYGPWQLGFRAESTEDRLDPNFYKQNAVTIGARYQLQDNASLRAEVIDYKLEPGAGLAKYSLQVVSLGGVFKF